MPRRVLHRSGCGTFPLHLFCLLIVLALLPWQAPAQGSPPPAGREWVVATRSAPPFAMKNGSGEW
ncbi:hypothetical protein [Teichococcus vastitatis]|jgi:hypothetical protein|uniref:Uncharacterized protein n=1 Tax=Teichococcus vastitatis TaxID=2307076 RepID=A0ABS9W7K5_9PROT|nr:hypothetical protein [Pseudoroseomonas vastitatis]MCI0755266.1 hypothetical protein [Pseudoroseomonas vastitatis]